MSSDLETLKAAYAAAGASDVAALSDLFTPDTVSRGAQHGTTGVVGARSRPRDEPRRNVEEFIDHSR
jgi:hypothetical protein